MIRVKGDPIEKGVTKIPSAPKPAREYRNARGRPRVHPSPAVKQRAYRSRKAKPC